MRFRTSLKVGSEEGCTVGTLLLQPPPSAGTFVCAVTGQVVSESVSAFLALIIGPWSQEVVVVVVVVVCVCVCVCVIEKEVKDRCTKTSPRVQRSLTLIQMVNSFRELQGLSSQVTCLSVVVFAYVAPPGAAPLRVIISGVV